MQKHFAKIIAFLSIFLTSLSIWSCKKASESTESIVYPDIFLKDATYLLGRSDEQDILFKAEEISIYTDDKTAELKNASFEQKKENGEDILVSGSATSATINTYTYVSTLSGDVHILLHEDNNSIDADEIFWDKDRSQITSKGNLTLNYGDVKITGVNFEGNIKNGVFTFKAITEGIIKGADETPQQSEELPITEPQEEETPVIDENENTSEEESIEIITPPQEESDEQETVEEETSHSTPTETEEEGKSEEESPSTAPTQSEGRAEEAPTETPTESESESVSSEEIEKNSENIETFEPIVDIIIISRDGKIRE